MSADVLGILIVVICGLLYFLLKEKDKKAAQYCLYGATFGAGMLATALWIAVQLQSFAR